jgi:hypothetical protein
MWLTTPRFLACLALLAVAMAAVAWAQDRGVIAGEAARWIYAGGALLLMAGVAWRARARWRSWSSR